MTVPIASPVLIKDELVPHATSAESLFERRDVEFRVGGELVTEHVETKSQVWVFIQEPVQVATPFFENDRSVEELAREQQRFLERMGDDFVDLE